MNTSYSTPLTISTYGLVLINKFILKTSFFNQITKLKSHRPKMKELSPKMHEKLTK